MKSTDLIILLVSLTGALLLLQYSTQYAIEPIFKLPILSSRLVRTSDLDADGTQEVLVARSYTDEQRLRHVLTVFAVTRDSSLHVRHTAHLPHTPRALTAGSFSAGQPQHVIVVSDTAEVTCYNHVLALVWTTSLALRTTAELHVTAYVTDKPLRKFDEGAVVVCARDQSEHVTAADSGWQCRALDGRTGAIRWEFNEHDTEHAHEATRVKMSDVNWKIQRAMAGHVSGHVSGADVNCQSFAQSLASVQAADPMHGAHLHRWYEARDTQLALVSLARGRSVRTVPNALLLHTVAGLHVLHYYTGLALCHVPLSPAQLYVDLNRDSTVEALHVSGCHLRVDTAMTPHPRPLFNVSLCRAEHVPLISAPLVSLYQGTSHVLTLTSTGELRSVNEHGGTHWHGTVRADRDAQPFVHLVPHTALVLAVAGRHVTLVDGRGTHVASVRADEAAEDVQLGDVTGDGVADLLVFSATQLAGYRLALHDTLSPRNYFTVSLLVLWLLVLLALLHRQLRP